MKQYCFGVDLGGSTVKIGLFTQKGDLVEKWEMGTRKEQNGKYILTDIATSIADKMNERDLVKSNVLGIGIGVPGPVISGSTVIGCVNLGWGLEKKNVAEILYNLTGVPCKVANDSNVAALGEQWRGSGKGYESLVLINLGTGVGGGIVSGGRIVDGVNGSAGEIGHMIMVSPEDYRGTCGCGHSGCLEQVASTIGLVKLAGIILDGHDEPSTLREIADFSAKDVIEQAKAGDKLAGIAVEKMFDYIGRATASLACLFDPEVFVIGGGMAGAGEYLLEGIQRYYRKYVFHASSGTKFMLATLGNDAGITGAAKMVCTVDK